MTAWQRHSAATRTSQSLAPDPDAGQWLINYDPTDPASGASWSNYIVLKSTILGRKKCDRVLQWYSKKFSNYNLKLKLELEQPKFFKWVNHDWGPEPWPEGENCDGSANRQKLMAGQDKIKNFLLDTNFTLFFCFCSNRYKFYEFFVFFLKKCQFRKFPPTSLKFVGFSHPSVIFWKVGNTAKHTKNRLLFYIKSVSFFIKEK